MTPARLVLTLCRCGPYDRWELACHSGLHVLDVDALLIAHEHAGRVARVPGGAWDVTEAGRAWLGVPEVPEPRTRGERRAVFGAVMAWVIWGR